MYESSYWHLLRKPGFAWMLVTQFLAALNDNLYKFVVTLFAIDLVAANRAAGIQGWDSNAYLFLASALFVLPFLLFSDYAGQLADRHSKRTVLVITKSAEIGIMLLAAVAFYDESIGGMLFVLFLLATQATFFSPAKYGCVPELLPDRDLSRGNALIEMSTFLAIILGAVSGGIIYDHWKSEMLDIAAVAVAISILGSLASLGIGRTPKPTQAKPFSWIPFREVWIAIRQLKANYRLWLTVLGISYFWFLGAWVQLLTTQYGKELMHLGDSQTSLLQAAMAIGIGVGSMLAGRFSGHKVELGLVPLGSIGMGLTAIAMLFADYAFGWAAAGFGILGFFGGFFIVPLNAMLQQKAAADIRGRLIAANNVLNNVGILCGAGALLLCGHVLGLRPDQSMLVSGLLSFSVTIYLCLLLPDFLIRFCLWLLTHSIYRIRIEGPQHVPLNGPALLVCNHLSFIDGLIVGACVQRFIRFMVYAPFFDLPLFGWLFRLMKAIPTSGGRNAVRAISAARAELQAGHVVCIFAEGAISRTGNMLPFKRGVEKILDGLDVPVIPVHLDQVWGSVFSFKGGRFFWKWPLHFFYPVTVTFGAPVPASSRASSLRRRLLEMGGDAFRLRRTRDDLVHLRFLRRAKKTWTRFCMADSTGRELNYGRALVGSILLSRWLRHRCLTERMVGLVLPASVGGALANMAALFAGKVPVNLNFTAGHEALKAAIAKAEIKTILTSRAFLQKAKLAEEPGMVFMEDVMKRLAGPEAKLIYLLAWLLPARWLDWLYCDQDREPADLCTVIFSSGSTGEPKGVMLSHHNIVSNLESIAQLLWVQRDDKMMGILPFFHAFGFTGTFCLPLVCGFGVVYHPNPLDGKTIGKLVANYRATLLIATPTFCQTYLRQCSREDFASLRHVVVGAERLRPELAKAFEEKFGHQLLEGYGTTEMGPVVSVNVPNIDLGPDTQTGTKPGTVGHPIPGVAAQVVDPESGADLGENQEGLLLLKSPARMLGYLGDPEKTASVLRDDWYVTGDIAVIDNDGFIRITDRLARFSKLGGEMVPHLRIEEALMEVPGIEAAAVTAVPDSQKGERLVGFYVSHTDLAPDEVWKALGQSNLPRLWIPKAGDLLPLGSLPVLGIGKIDLKQIKSLAAAHAMAPASVT
ncbi:acyl-[ACP]--phospholipid O-acyltransferase [Dongia soli]|uniref:Acyl-[ACP]--phospholipid O-acyltransferase n=1 Tax=Dongia soli TaxID=600628 RepID=A0ABU5E9K4_9PROT|nr:acyl-[ACP]--phospholipid O-acyltransferase [Dongia soli]MDY0882531.1 acyl-[ACP]--phospholipid O-acyltransferase [Dongia soli]